MNPPFYALTIFAASAAVAMADPIPALEACKALPEAQQKSVARVVGREGKPLPETWTVLAHDPLVQNGLREFTVTGSTVVASRGISDYAQHLTEGDTIDLTAIRFDATQLAELAAAYADASEVTPAAFNYEMRKEGKAAAPLWKISAIDESGRQLGELVVTANTGTLVTQSGFSQAPELKDLAAMAQAEGEEEKQDDQPEKATAKTRSRSKGQGTNSTRRPNTFRKIGGKLQKFFTGKNTIGR